MVGIMGEDGREGVSADDPGTSRQWRVRPWMRIVAVLMWCGLAVQQWDVVRRVRSGQMPVSERRDGYISLALLAIVIYLLAFRPRVVIDPQWVTLHNPLSVRRFPRSAVAGLRMSRFGLVFELSDASRRRTILFQDTLAFGEPRWFEVAEAVSGERPAPSRGGRDLAGSGLDEYVVNADALPDAERASLGRAVLTGMRPFAQRFEIDLPDPSPDAPTEVREAADVLRRAAAKTSDKERDYAMSGWLDATEPDVWQAFLTFMPWSFDGTVQDADGRAIVSLADGEVISVAVAPEHLPAIAAIAAGRLRPWLAIEAERRASRHRWMRRHPDVMAAWCAICAGVLLVPLARSGLLVTAAGAVVLLAGVAIRGVAGAGSS